MPPGKKRDRALSRMVRAVRNIMCAGIRTSLCLVRALNTVFQGSNGYASGYGGWPCPSLNGAGFTDLWILKFRGLGGVFASGLDVLGGNFGALERGTIRQRGTIRHETGATNGTLVKFETRNNGDYRSQ